MPPARAATPKPATRGWARNAVDALVLARLEKEGLKPSPEAKRETLLRRVTLDLTGLPPTPAEMDAFLADQSPDAYEKVVDRLLASPRYGERMASDWLDLARYADTHGYQMDRYRATWPWRDWVIKAFNENLPYDDFLTWQLAGDLLPNPTKEQRLATAFNRHHMQNEEGGIVEEEFRIAYVADRVNTMGTAFLGLTFECARCHDHKYDPITQKDFYSLFAFFQNIDESGQTTYFTDAVPVPTLLLSDDATDAKLAAAKARIAEAEARLAGVRDAADADFEKWLAARPAEPPALAGTVGRFTFDEIPDGTVANVADATKPGKLVESPELIDGKHGKAARLDGEDGFTFPGVGHFTRSDPFTLALWLRAEKHEPRAVMLHHSKAPVDAGSRGYEILLEGGRVAFGLHHMWPGNALKVVSTDRLPVGRWSHVAVTYDGSSRAAGVRVYVDGAATAVDVVRDKLTKDITYAGGEPDLAVGHRFRDSGFKGGAVDDLIALNWDASALEIARLAGRTDYETAWTTPTERLTAEQRSGLRDVFLAGAHAPSVEAATALRAVRDEQRRLIEPVPEIMVMQELATPKPAHVLKRGAYDAPGEAVSPDVPASLGSFPKDQPRNRLGLARWLLQPDHPLTARVTVNRLWQQMFGRGLVETSDNFGSQGGQPSHPELLDGLARTFVDDLDWDVKRLLKLVAMSATYRQSSRTSADLLARDPANELLARGPARRLTAEMLRDGAIAVSGLLTEKLGGPSVKPYQPDGVWDVAMGRPTYDRSSGPDLYRRSLYTFWKRTVPPPSMVTFDAADRSVCAAQRQSTSTPLQALAMLNDPQLVEAARFVGQRMMKEGGTTPDARLPWAFRLVTGRPPTARELPLLRQLFDEQRALFSADPAAATKLLAVGEAKPDASLDPVDLAAATVLAQALLSHDEAYMRR